MALRQSLSISLRVAPRAWYQRTSSLQARLISTSQPADFHQTPSEVPPSTPSAPLESRDRPLLSSSLGPSSQISQIQQSLHKKSSSQASSSSSVVPELTSSNKLPRLTLPYHVSRSATNNLPIYSEIRNTLYLTIIRKVSGDSNNLRDEVAQHLNLDEEWCYVKQPSGHVVVKGRRKAALEAFLREKGF